MKLDQRAISRKFYTDSNSYALTGTIYSDEELSTAANITGLTLTIKFYTIPDDGETSDTADIVTAASGTWRYKPSDGELPESGVYAVVIELSVSGSVIPTINRQEILIR